MKLIQSITVPILLAVLGAGTISAWAADQEGVAIAIVYDTSESMKEPVKDAAGRSSPKYLIANRALVSIANRIESFVTNGAPESPRKVQAGLYVFQKGQPHVALPIGPFKADALKGWVRGFTEPTGNTPLGSTLQMAGQAVLKSGMMRKHVVVITDGENTSGPAPEATLAKLQQAARQKETGVSVHFVAFDVDAKVFEGLKKLGATVVSASNESQLNTQLEFILEKKILLEDEEPVKKK